MKCKAWGIFISFTNFITGPQLSSWMQNVFVNHSQEYLQKKSVICVHTVNSGKSSYPMRTPEFVSIHVLGNSLGCQMSNRIVGDELAILYGQTTLSSLNHVFISIAHANLSVFC